MSTPCENGQSASPGTERPVRDGRWTARRCGLAAAAFMSASYGSLTGLRDPGPRSHRVVGLTFGAWVVAISLAAWAIPHAPQPKA